MVPSGLALSAKYATCNSVEVELQPAESEASPTGPIVRDPSLGLNEFLHCEPGQGSVEFDLRPHIDVDDISWAEQPLTLEFLSEDVKSAYIQSYITFFHPSLPILHPPTLSTLSSPPVLLMAVLAIGCIYSASKSDRPDALDPNAKRKLSRNLWRCGCHEVKLFVEKHRPRWRTPWVLQSYVLLIVYGTFTGDEKCISKSRDMYRIVVDALRDFELLHQKSVFPAVSAWDWSLSLSASPEETQRTWQLFIDQESTKLALYALYYFDFHLFASFNMRPMLSSIEFEWDLPMDSALWEAESAKKWWHAILQRQLESSDGAMLGDQVQIKSLLVASQSLLSNTASPVLRKTLSSSAFATLCIVASLESLVRDFTRSYYQLPPTLADPSPFHILSQSQNAKVSTAIVSILSITTDKSCSSCDSSCVSLWHAVILGCLSIKISLCKPDDLLVGGIIEASPAAGLATSVHLNLGDYVSTRRSGSSTRRKPIAENGFVAILDEMLTAMHEMGTSTVSPLWEGPWTTVQGFKILIILWQALRFSIAELQSQVCPPPGVNKYAKVYDPARSVVHCIITALDIYDPLEIHISHESLSTPEDLDNVDQLETQFIYWMRKLCDRRDVWDIGPSMGKVLDEICAVDEM
ncbi:Zinc finger protein [Lachnellula occidentalis]|uniref:Zinc finger protein n=1 Tax=Lachnellula occidentalis TaxID=215460 RepID=A0A8H8UHK6_9HELO|nr:Zinc finger protein [Lachnellula occidentalis]